MKRNAECGMTVAEVCVVLAVVAMVATALISFTVIIIREGQRSMEYLDSLREIRLAEAIIEAEIEAEGDIEIRKYERLNGELKVGVHTFLKIKSIEITDIINETDKLYVCQLKYDLSGSEENYTFCVNSRVGDVIYGGAP